VVPPLGGARLNRMLGAQSWGADWGVIA
jgi:hypothetical protein